MNISVKGNEEVRVSKVWAGPEATHILDVDVRAELATTPPEGKYEVTAPVSSSLYLSCHLLGQPYC